MDKGVVAHMLVDKVFACKVGNTIMKLVMNSCDEAALLAVQRVSYR